MEDAGDCPVIWLTDDARDRLRRVFECFELEGRRGSLRRVKPFAPRATEQACSDAGVLAALSGRHLIDKPSARDALALVDFSLETWRAIVDEGAADTDVAHALRLDEWPLTAPPAGASGWLSSSRTDRPACGPRTSATRRSRC